jgi:hypothetical protein
MLNIKWAFNTKSTNRCNRTSEVLITDRCKLENIEILIELLGVYR